MITRCLPGAVAAAAAFLFTTSLRSATAAEWDLSRMVERDAEGRPVYRAKQVEERFRNPWPEEYEREFQERARHIIAAQSDVRAKAGNTYFENEKRTYGYLMAQAIGTRRMAAVADLQVEDAQAKEWHEKTSGIDYYAAFTLKHQVRKYFYFGDVLAPEYRRRMFEGARAWTEVDPLRRPHYTFKKPKPGWGPDARNSWVDVRSTENLFLMRVTSVYLMAEETGSAATAAKYKRIVLDYARSLYRLSMGEWDSENYHGHSMAPLVNLYDFAKDPEVKMAAKACLDWVFAIGAVKYYRGGFNGPTKRDYNHAQPFGGSAPSMLWVMFGDCPRMNEHWESDEVHLVTTAYRPPAAVVKLARKEFEKPVEIFAAKPSYSATTSFKTESKPEYLETQYIANSYQMGSLTCGTLPGKSDVNGFKILVRDEAEGARALHAVPGPDPEFPGSPMYREGKVSAANRVAQYANLCVWLVRDGKSPWLWVVPRSVNVSREGGVTFLECDRTWVAVRPLGTSEFVEDAAMTERLARAKKPRFPGHKVLAAAGRGGGFSGVAVEVGERESHGTFAEFRRKALAAEVDAGELQSGIVRYKAADGKWLGFHWSDDPFDLGVWRNGARHDLRKHARYLYRSGDRLWAAGPIHSRWGDGTLYVEAGGEAFACRVDGEGRVTFANGTPQAVRAKIPPE
jgi:hypothetical protein